MARVAAKQLIWHHARPAFRLCPLLLLGACAAALPGYVPPSLKGKRASSRQALTSGEVNAEGRYEMSEQEKLMDCKRTTGAMLITISWLRHR